MSDRKLLYPTRYVYIMSRLSLVRRVPSVQRSSYILIKLKLKVRPGEKGTKFQYITELIVLSSSKLSINFGFYLASYLADIRTISTGVKRPERELETHRYPSRACIACCFIEHKDNFTFAVPVSIVFVYIFEEIYCRPNIK